MALDLFFSSEYNPAITEKDPIKKSDAAYLDAWIVRQLGQKDLLFFSIYRADKMSTIATITNTMTPAAAKKAAAAAFAIATTAIP